VKNSTIVVVVVVVSMIVVVVMVVMVVWMGLGIRNTVEGIGILRRPNKN